MYNGSTKLILMTILLYTVRQHMTQRHDHIAQAVVMVVDGCDNFAIMTSGHILIAKRGLKSINLIQWHIILKARHLSIL